MHPLYTSVGIEKIANFKYFYITMNKNNSMNFEGKSYVTPSVNVLDVQAEGVLCGSFTGGRIDDATEEDWGTL